MAARRLLIVMLVLLGISTLAAALVPQRTLNDDTTTGQSTSTQQQTTTAPEASTGRTLTAEITVGLKKPAVVVAGPVCAKVDGKRECGPPIQVGDQLTLLVLSKPAAQLEIRAFGLVQFAAPNSPAQFELLPEAPGPIGINFAGTDRVAARVEVLSAKEARKEAKRGKRSKRPARGGSGRP